MYQPVSVLEWAEGIQGRRIERVFPRQANGITALTIELEGGKLFDLFLGERRCEACGQGSMVPQFWVPGKPQPNADTGIAVGHRPFDQGAFTQEELAEIEQFDPEAEAAALAALKAGQVAPVPRPEGLLYADPDEYPNLNEPPVFEDEDLDFLYEDEDGEDEEEPPAPQSIPIQQVQEQAAQKVAQKIGGKKRITREEFVRLLQATKSLEEVRQLEESVEVVD